MKVESKRSENGGLFYIELEGETRAQLDYSGPQNGHITATHTEVADSLRHQHAGYKMVEALVEYARRHQLKIVPACPFVESVFDKKPEYSDVWHQD